MVWEKEKRRRKSTLSWGDMLEEGWEEGRPEGDGLETMHMPAHAGPAPTWTLITSK